MKKTLLVVGLIMVLTAAIPLTWADPPDMSGPFVARFEGTFWTFWVDARLPQFIFVGADLGEACMGPFEVSTFQSLDVFLPQQDSVIIDIFTMDDAVAAVWPIIGGANTLCDAWANAGGVPLASGTLDVTGTDNDLGALDGDNERENAFTIKANGVLATLAGDLVHVNSHSNCRFDGAGISTLVCRNKVSLR